MNPNESTSPQEDKERIEKDAIRYEDKNPYDAIHSAYFMGAITEHRRNAACRQSIAELKEKLIFRETQLVEQYAYLNEEIRDCKKSLNELIKIIEAHKGDISSEKMIILYNSESAIERAKALIK
jgi:hypothetical protein